MFNLFMKGGVYMVSKKYKIPTFIEWMELQDRKADTPDKDGKYRGLTGQFKYLYDLFCTEMPLCYVENKSASMMALCIVNDLNPKDVGWDMVFRCPYTGKKMVAVVPIMGAVHLAPVKVKA